MNLKNQTILITGGSSGIGFELASQLLALGNTVIITGRDEKKLSEAKKKLPQVNTIKSDASRPEDVKLLFSQVMQKFPEVNVLINNAGIMRKINLHAPNQDLNDLTREIEINLMGPIWMVKEFLSHLKTKEHAAIINVSSGLAFVPFPISPIYSATKAGLHAFTECLRIQLKNTSVKVFELAPPGTETPLFRGDFSEQDLGGVKAMSVQELVQKAIKGLENDTLEIRPGLANMLKIMSRVAPQTILKQLGKAADNMLRH